ncbi:MAG: YfhO family protein [bacterium]
MSLTPAADMVASAGMYRMGEEAIRNGRFPLWNPTLFCGLPMFSSLQYALFVYPPEFIIRVLSYIFGTSSYRVWFFHYWMAGIFMALLARHKGVGLWGSLLAGLAYAFSPQLIVLVDVGHGSKLMAMTYLPLIWLMLERLKDKPSLGRAIGLGGVTAIEILALHPQVAAYGAITIGLFFLYYGLVPLGKKLLKSERGATGKANLVRGELGLLGYGSIGLMLAILLSAILWVSVLDYARFSIRGATSPAGAIGGGVNWEYATGWSFHPIESLSYLFPKFFGFANETYWGTVGTPDGTPFTHNPMYFGIGVLALALLAMITLPKERWGFPLTLAVISWVLSFGRYLPLIYKPLYLYLPLFNKFRAPVMGQVLLLLSMALMAGLGWQALCTSHSAIPDERRKRVQAILKYGAGISAGLILFTIILGTNGYSLYQAFSQFVKSGVNERILRSAWEIAMPDIIRSLVLLLIMGGFALAVMQRGGAVRRVWGVGAVGLLLIDLLPISYRLVHFVPSSTVQDVLREEGIVRYLKKEEGPFRLHSLDTGYKPINWWSYHGIAVTTGYFGAKMADYQAFMEAFGLDQPPPNSWITLHKYPKVIDLLNSRFLITSYPIEMITEELEKQGYGAAARKPSEWRLEVTGRELKPGRGPFLYRNLQSLSRVRIVGEYQIIKEREATFAAMKNPYWDPSRLVLLDRKPQPEPDPQVQGSAQIVSYQNEEVVVATHLNAPGVLILADSYYPSGWKAYINGKEVEILRAYGVLRAVALPSGSHQVVFRFRPPLFYTGLILSLAGLAAIIGYGVIRWRKIFSKRGPNNNPS